MIDKGVKVECVVIEMFFEISCGDSFGVVNGDIIVVCVEGFDEVFV